MSTQLRVVGSSSAAEKPRFRWACIAFKPQNEGCSESVYSVVETIGKNNIFFIFINDKLLCLTVRLCFQLSLFYLLVFSRKLEAIFLVRPSGIVRVQK